MAPRTGGRTRRGLAPGGVSLAALPDDMLLQVLAALPLQDRQVTLAFFFLEMLCSKL